MTAKCTGILIALSHARHVMPARTLKVVVQALVLSIVRYCMSVYGSCGVTRMARVQKIINFCARGRLRSQTPRPHLGRYWGARLVAGDRDGRVPHYMCSAASHHDRCSPVYRRDYWTSRAWCAWPRHAERWPCNTTESPHWDGKAPAVHQRRGDAEQYQFKFRSKHVIVPSQCQTCDPIETPLTYVLRACVCWFSLTHMSMFLSCYVSSEKPPFVVDLRRIHINQSINRPTSLSVLWHSIVTPWASCQKGSWLMNTNAWRPMIVLKTLACSTGFLLTSIKVHKQKVNSRYVGLMKDKIN